MMHINVKGLLGAAAGEHRARLRKVVVESSLHRMDSRASSHMEAPILSYTIGDFFRWGACEVGPAQVGGLSGFGGDHLTT